MNASSNGIIFRGAIGFVWIRSCSEFDNKHKSIRPWHGYNAASEVLQNAHLRLWIRPKGLLKFVEAVKSPVLSERS